VMSYAALTALGATLTLPGLAGFVLAIGMAVDANVLVFERAREDYIAGRTDGLRRSLRSGFQNALSAIADDPKSSRMFSDSRRAALASPEAHPR